MLTSDVEAVEPPRIRSDHSDVCFPPVPRDINPDVCFHVFLLSTSVSVIPVMTLSLTQGVT